MNPLTLAMLGIGLAGGIGKMFGRGSANRQLDQLLAKEPIDTGAQQRLGLATTMLNARMPGAAAEEKNIYGSQANTLAFAEKNATDASQVQAVAAQAQGQTNRAFSNLGIQEDQDYQRRFNNLGEAQNAVYQDQLRRWMELVGIRGAQQENRQNTMGDISNMGFGLANFGLQGGFKGLFGGGGTPSVAPAYSPMTDPALNPMNWGKNMGNQLYPNG